MKLRTIWEINIEIDKMSWLRLKWENQGKQEVLSIKWWDDKRDIVVKWILDWENIEVIPKHFIDSEFNQFDDAGNPVPFAQRSGALWRPKTIWCIRLATLDWVNFIVNLHNSNWEVIVKLWSWFLDEEKKMEISTDFWTRWFALFDPKIHAQKINKIFLQNQ